MHIIDSAISVAEVTTSERLSTLMGWLSIACWVIVYTPQIHENYVLKSSEGLSIWFILIWLGGDTFNLFGGVLQGVLWTMIFLAGYYVFCDLLLIYQWWYYGKYYRDGKYIGNGTGEEATLLGHDDEPSNEPLGSAIAQTYDTLVRVTNGWNSHHVAIYKYTAAVVFVIVTGVVAWIRAGVPSNVPKAPLDDMPFRWDAQVLGWLSAFLYLSSRIPQIIKNRETKCMGLSLALFVFALFGNLTYILSIMLLSRKRMYLVENSSWLVGSVGTILLDMVVLTQFFVYAPARREIMAGRALHHTP
ncbi:hypothetical protein MCUN1_002734 [Malassezia cuniculi]|uniref:Uncharacterized protein n=1 Tax=Malassezia cuniculi TaxID=948313 RepID=A0AAF0JC20_9BASI|nr:hypothetical protein MCUN1_002734 [Malassezia cuniculi]